MLNNRPVTALIFSIVLIMIACSVPKHSNTLMFATNTKLAIDVSADPTGYPSETVGYSRQEGVWMPLLANKDDKGTPQDDINFPYLGKQGNEQDTYSVLASFGATFSAESTAGREAMGAKAATGGGLAQFFATGLAARILADKGGSRLVSVQPDDGVSQNAVLIITKWEKDIDSIIKAVQKGEDGIVDKERLEILLENTGLDKDTFIKKF
jgi:hypothetical protein